MRSKKANTVSVASVFMTAGNQAPDRVELEDVPLPAGMRAPTHGLTCLYGMRDAVDELARLHRVAAERDMDLRTLRIDMHFDLLPRGHIGLKPEVDAEGILVKRVIHDYRMVSLDRIALDVAGLVEARLREEYGDRYDEVSPFRNGGFITPDAAMIDIIHEMEPFRHMELLIYRIADPEHGPRQVATLFSDAPVKRVDSMGLDVEVLLPARIRGHNTDPLSDGGDAVCMTHA